MRTHRLRPFRRAARQNRPRNTDVSVIDRPEAAARPVRPAASFELHDLKPPGAAVTPIASSDVLGRSSWASS
jgi:hypothetical protein